VNSQIVQRIWVGQERFADLAEPAGLLAFITERTPRLFKLYERVLNRASRHRNLALARQNPPKWRVPGALEFMEYLRDIKVRNFFVTGSVVSDGGMADDVAALGYPVGPGELVEDLVGCPWDRKWPKNEVMADLCQRLSLDPATTLILGDGRSEIKAGVDMGAVTISRLDASAARLRQLHRQIGANLILADFADPVLRQVIRAE
jgi:phosphoglycolate phosphatase-like HAD superfamily hydrolase